MDAKETPLRWYDRERWPYAADKEKRREYTKWLRLVSWKFFGTFTFPGKVSDPQAETAFDEFINDLEKLLKCDVCYVRGDEKRFSGCGKPASGRHFHALMTCAAPVTPCFIKSRWIQVVRGHNEDADVRPYDAHKNGAAYVLKFIDQTDGDWAHRKLYLFHPAAMSLHDNTPRERRRLQRHRARVKHFQHHPPPTVRSPA